MANPWLVALNAADDRAIRLICFAHAGGGPSLFKPWGDMARGRLSVLGALLPGREVRFREQNYRNVGQIIDALVENLMPVLDRPFILFGHSFGSVLAFELARRATALGRPPAALVASGRRAPHLGARRPELHSLDPDALIAALGALEGTPSVILEDSKLMGLFLPCLRADLECNETYAPLPGPTLRCPIRALMGRDDSEVNESELLAWREVTSGPFSKRVFDGGHFYLKDDMRGVLAAIEETVLSPAFSTGI